MSIYTQTGAHSQAYRNEREIIWVISVPKLMELIQQF